MGKQTIFLNLKSHKMKPAKLYNIQMSRSGRGSSDRISETGPRTVDALKQYFGYTLEIGRSWNRKIKHPDEIKTIKQLMTALEKSYEEKESACYTRTDLTLIEC
jgi:hypothetical protein